MLIVIAACEKPSWAMTTPAAAVGNPSSARAGEETPTQAQIESLLRDIRRDKEISGPAGLACPALACGVLEHEGARQRGLAADHAQHVPRHAPVLAVDGGLRGDPHRAVVEHLHIGP
jgi:hypothetical protein